MRKNYRGNMLLAAMLVLVMMLCSFPMAYAEDAGTAIPVPEQESAPETGQESMTFEAEPEVIQEEEPVAESEPVEVPEERTATEPEPAEVPEEEPAAEAKPVEIPEEVPEAEHEPAEVPEEEPAAEPEPAEVPEEEPAEEPEPVEVPEEETEGDADEEASEDTLYEFDDNEVGSVSDELLEIFNNPDLYEEVEFTGSVDIVLKNSEICYDRDVTLVARVSGADMDYRLVWEANDGSGWFAVASGEEYTFLLTPDIAAREYRVVLFRVC